MYKMKLLAISDTYIPADLMKQGLSSLQDINIDVEVRHWAHDTLELLQEDNLAIETGGPGAVDLGDELTAGLEEFDIVVVQFAPVRKTFIEKAKNLKMIVALRGGIENVDKDFAAARNISVLNTPGRNARAVAECTMGLILSEIRNIARSHNQLKAGNWTRDYPNEGGVPELYGKTVGLVGYGYIAQLVAGYLRAFGSEIIAYDPYFQGDPLPTQLVDLETLMKHSDVVSIHSRLTEDNYHMIGEKQLALMKPTAVLVNTARSGLVDEKALVRCLQQKKIMGAALDVFDDEPLPDDTPFLKLDNVTITAHLAGSTIDALVNSPVLFAQWLADAVANGSKLPVVNDIEPVFLKELGK